MTGALARLGGVAADLGWGRALRVAAVWALRRRYLLLHVDLPTLRARVPAPPPMPPTMRVGFLTDAARPALQALDPAMTPPEVSRRLAEGQECLLGWWRDELVHYRWTVVGAAYLPYLGRRLAPPPGEVLVVENYTAPRARGRGIASRVMMADVARHNAAGRAGAVWLSAWWNTASLALSDQLGSWVVGSVGYWGAGPLRRYFATGVARFDADGTAVVALP
ncbi:MAG TPA: hypothetical protein VFC42_14400 [Methylomirabilota bacterium]|nr:hypothetical protein [Methylomirabilota bacterium]